MLNKTSKTEKKRRKKGKRHLEGKARKAKDQRGNDQRGVYGDMRRRVEGGRGDLDCLDVFCEGKETGRKREARGRSRLCLLSSSGLEENKTSEGNGVSCRVRRRGRARGQVRFETAKMKGRGEESEEGDGEGGIGYSPKI